MLAQMTVRLLRKRTFEDAIHVILDDVIALHGAEFGNVQLPLGDELVIAAQYAFPNLFLKLSSASEKTADLPAAGPFGWVLRWSSPMSKKTSGLPHS